MVKDIRVEVSDEQYEHLNGVKEKHGLTWRGMLILAAKDLEQAG